jgi:hypothetical protein
VWFHGFLGRLPECPEVVQIPQPRGDSNAERLGMLKKGANVIGWTCDIPPKMIQNSNFSKNIVIKNKMLGCPMLRRTHSYNMIYVYICIYVMEIGNPTLFFVMQCDTYWWKHIRTVHILIYSFIDWLCSLFLLGFQVAITVPASGCSPKGIGSEPCRRLVQKVITDYGAFWWNPMCFFLSKPECFITYEGRWWCIAYLFMYCVHIYIYVQFYNIVYGYIWYSLMMIATLWDILGCGGSLKWAPK